MFHLRRPPARRTTTATAVTVAAAVILSACGGGGGGDSGSPAATAAPQTSATGDGAGTDSDTALQATATDILDALLTTGDVIGDDIDLTAVDGRPVVAWFWAPWCTTCRAEGPTVAEIAATYRDDVVLIGVPGRGDDADMQRFIDDTGTGDITHVADLGGDIWSDFGVFAQPAFAFITADGEVDVFVGTLGERGLVERIEALTTS